MSWVPSDCVDCFEFRSLVYAPVGPTDAFMVRELEPGFLGKMGSPDADMPIEVRYSDEFNRALAEGEAMSK